MQATMHHLDLFYGLTKLKYAGEIMFRNRFTTEQTTIIGLDYVSNYWKTQNQVDAEQPMLKIYQLSNQLATNSCEENLKLLKNEIIKNENSIDNKELSQLLTFVINFNTYISRHDNIDLSRNSYELFRLGLQREIFNVNGLIRPNFLINFAYLCTEFSNEKEILAMMKQYEDRLSLDVKTTTLHLCQAFVWWFQQEYKKAILVTINKPKRTFFFFLSQKLMQIKCFYELSFTNELDDYINKMLKERSSLLKYINSKREVINPYNLQSAINFSKIMLKLIDPNCTKTDLLALMEFKYKMIFERRWLLRKIEDK